MNFPRNSFKQRAHALVHQLPDNATWRDLIDTAIERMDLDAEAECAYAATITALDLGDVPSAEHDRYAPSSAALDLGELSSIEPDKYSPLSRHGRQRLAVADAPSIESEKRISPSRRRQERANRTDCTGVPSDPRGNPACPAHECPDPDPQTSPHAITDYDA